jgi:hypothetical protein
MGLNHSPRIVTDGLVLCLDAANRKSYPGSGNTWFDLSGSGIHGTLTNGPTFSSENLGFFSLDGTNDNVVLSNPSSNFVFGTEPFSLEFLIDINTAGFRYIIEGRNASQTASFALFVDSSRRIDYYNGTTSMIGPSLQTGNTGWIHLVLSRNSTSSNDTRIYINTGLYLTGTDSRNHSTAPTTSYLGMRFNSSEHMSGKFAICRVYKNKALSPQEIQQNFNALRGRYGI